MKNGFGIPRNLVLVVMRRYHEQREPNQRRPSAIREIEPDYEPPAPVHQIYTSSSREIINFDQGKWKIENVFSVSVEDVETSNLKPE